ncbi:RHS repeat domain-containing protein [Treponema pedis]|uniref:RHS repeat domain-containing protein n=1 Tax=Treponema pedis TaxID=409322 RepID=UPI003D1C797A
MKPKLSIYSQVNYLTSSRTAIEAKILFAVCISKKQALTGEKSLAYEDKCSKKIGAVLMQQVDRRSFEASAVLNFVFFIILKNKIEQSAVQRCLRPFELRVLPFGKTSGIKVLNLLNKPTDRTFENRHVGCKEREKINRRRTLCTLRINFFEATPQTACIFSKEMTHTDNHGDNDEQKEKRYYYHSDHLGSAQFVTDWKGRQYEHIEYTPYGELWTYKSKTAKLFLTTYNNFLAKQPGGLIEETAPGIDKLPFRFTGKELDEETGLYYYGARYLDPKYSRWLSGDPALGEYIPKAPIDDEAKKHNENLPGMGGVFNVVNLHVYNYAGNNPVKYTDPDGRTDRYMDDGVFIAHIDDGIDGVEIFTYKYDNNKELQSLGYLTNPDGSYISSKHFDELVSAIYSEAKGNDDKENRGMGEVIFNRMNEQQLPLHDTLYHKYSGIDGMKKPKFFTGLAAMEKLKKAGILNINGYGENESFINSIIGAIHGMRGYSFITNKAGFYWSHGINRKGLFNKLMTVNGCDFFNLTKSGWNLNKRYWP